MEEERGDDGEEEVMIEEVTMKDPLAEYNPDRNSPELTEEDENKLLHFNYEEEYEDAGEEEETVTEEKEGETKTPAELIAAGARGELVAVNLCDPNESDLRQPELSASVQNDPPATGSLPWFYLSLFALGLVVSEWVLFNRRVVA